MPNIITLHDTIDKNDPDGRTIKEINMAQQHVFKVGQLVELDSGVRLLVGRHSRDCDGTPLYDLAYYRKPMEREDNFSVERWLDKLERHYPEHALEAIPDA